MPLDPQAQVFLDQIMASGQPPIHQQTPQNARKGLEAARAMLGPGEPVHKVEDRRIPGPGGEIPIRIYSPASRPNGIVLHFHGGGWVLGDLESHAYLCRGLTNASGCVVVAVDYRLAPENKFPAAPEDCYAATKWVAQNADAMGSDAGHLAIIGDSAGGNLAVVAALMARDRGGPKLRHLSLVYPAIEYHADTQSMRELGDKNYFLSKPDMDWFWGHYLRSASDADNSYACPNRATELHNLPSAHVITAEYDPLRDEGEAFAEQLKRAGNKVTVKRYPGMIHAFISFAALIDQGKVAIRELGEDIKSVMK